MPPISFLTLKKAEIGVWRLRATKPDGIYYPVDTKGDRRVLPHRRVDPNYGSPQDGSNHVFIPSQSTTSGNNQFPLDFLPGGTDGGWEIADSHGSLLLLYRGVKFPNIFNAKDAAKPELVVCEPMTRQYKEVPCQPEDLKGRHKCLSLFLLNGEKTRRFCGGGGGISLSNFKVMAALLRPHSYVVKRAWGNKEIHVLSTVESFYFAGRACGSLY
jgi:hypothetical protein